MKDDHAASGETENALADAGDIGELVFTIDSDNKLLVCPICQEVIGSSVSWSGCRDVLGRDYRPETVRPGVVPVKVDYLTECRCGGFELWLGFPCELFDGVEDPVALVSGMIRKAEERAAE